MASGTAQFHELTVPPTVSLLGLARSAALPAAVLVALAEDLAASR